MLDRFQLELVIVKMFLCHQDEWILESKIIVSPFGDFMVIASESCAVFLIKKYNPTPEFQICRTYKPSPFELSPDASIDCGLITAVFYLPVKIEQQGRSHDLLHCVVLGYSSGLSLIHKVYVARVTMIILYVQV